MRQGLAALNAVRACLAFALATAGGGPLRQQGEQGGDCNPCADSQTLTGFKTLSELTLGCTAADIVTSELLPADVPTLELNALFWKSIRGVTFERPLNISISSSLRR